MPPDDADGPARTAGASATMADLLARAAAAHPGRTALVDAASGRTMSWAELDEEADRVTRGLGALGLVAGYRLVLAMTNRPELVATYLGALRAGLVVVPVNPRCSTGELVRLLADCGPRVLVCDAPAATTSRQAVAGLEDALVAADEELRRRTPVPRLVVSGVAAMPGETAYPDLVAGPAPVAAAPLPADPERLAVLLSTSGTSGLPRPAMLTHRALLANVEQAAAVEPSMLREDDVVLGVLPMFHVYGLNAVLGQVLRRGARLVLVDGFDLDDTLRVVAEHQVSVLPVAPPVFAHWQAVPDLRERLAGVRVVLSGSAPLSAELVRGFTARTGIEVHQGYGLTEASPAVTSTMVGGTDGVGGGVPGSVGAALPGVEIRLVDEHGRPPEDRDPGEVLVRGANLFSGFWPDGADGPDEDGWYATGDVGYLDAEGRLFLVDRLKDLVVVSGFNVYPVEVETALTELDAVAGAAVVGVADDRTGEAVVAYVRPAPGTSYDAAELVELVREHCATRLARFKQPSEVHVVDRLPLTGTGKVARGRLRTARRQQTPGLLE